MFTLSVHEFSDYRAYLQAALHEKAKKNPSFSLRSFARFSGISPSYLSRVLSGKRGLSVASANVIARALEMAPEEATHFLDLIELDGAKDVEGKKKAIEQIAAKQTRTSKLLPIDAFQAVSDWHHFAILALMKTQGFKADSRWIANRLGIKPIEAKAGFERLLRLGLIDKVDGRYVPVDDANIETPHDTASAAIQENHRQHLDKASKILSELETDLREFANATLSMNLASIPKAKKRIRKFLDSFITEMERSNGQEVCQMNVQFYVLTKNQRGSR